MSDLVGNPEDRFSHNEAHFESASKFYCAISIYSKYLDTSENIVVLADFNIFIFVVILVNQE